MNPQIDPSAALPVPLAPDPSVEIRALAARHLRGIGPVMGLLQKFGGKLEDQLAHLPQSVRDRIDRVTETALRQSLALARHGSRAPDLGPRAAPALVAATGAAGGAGGLGTAMLELPVTVTLILHAILRAAEAEGFDTSLPEVQAEALRVLTSGGPLAEDDGINSSFFGARLTLTGPALHKLLAKVAPKFAAVLSQKLAAQAVPVLGAVSGAALNAAFLTHYRELAHIRFALLRLATLHGAERVRGEFEAELTRLRLPRR
jgi:hypothetical protein